MREVWNSVCTLWLIAYGLGFGMAVTGFAGIFKIWGGAQPDTRISIWGYVFYAVGGIVLELIAESKLRKEVNRGR